MPFRLRQNPIQLKFCIVSKPKLVGVTGGIGSGKTTVCKIFENLGAGVYYADLRAKNMMETNSILINKIKTIFGEKSYQTGKLDRKVIASQAFERKELLTQLNEAVHPAVRNDFKNWVTQNSTKRILLKEAALLIETRSHKELDHLILVLADEKTRIDRVVKRDLHRDKKDVKKIISEQLSDEEKIFIADFIIDNSGGKSLIKQTVDIYHQF